MTATRTIAALAREIGAETLKVAERQKAQNEPTEIRKLYEVNVLAAHN